MSSIHASVCIGLFAFARLAVELKKACRAATIVAPVPVVAGHAGDVSFCSLLTDMSLYYIFYFFLTTNTGLSLLRCRPPLVVIVTFFFFALVPLMSLLPVSFRWRLILIFFLARACGVVGAKIQAPNSMKLPIVLEQNKMESSQQAAALPATVVLQSATTRRPRLQR